MSSFTDATLIDTGRKREGRHIFRVIGGFYYELGFEGSGLRVYINDGYETDLGSIPTVESPGLFMKLVGAVCRLVIPSGAIAKAKRSFCIHDVLREDTRFTLLEGNHIFRMCMEAEGVPVLWANAFFWAVSTNQNRSKYNDETTIRTDVRPGFIGLVAR